MVTTSEQHKHGEERLPVAIPPEVPVDAGGALGWTSVTIGIAALLLALGNAAAVTGWLDERPPSATIAWIRPSVVAWERAMAELHLDAQSATLHRWWEAARAARFGDEQPGEPGTR